MESKYDSDAETNDKKLNFHNCLVVLDSPVPYFGPPLSLSYFWPPIFSSPPRLFLPVPYHPALPEDLSPDRAGSDSGYTPEKAKTGEWEDNLTDEPNTLSEPGAESVEIAEILEIKSLEQSFCSLLR